jgi:hypothetical protein
MAFSEDIMLIQKEIV